MKQLNIYNSSKRINGTITLNGSKSISNRVLMIQALATSKFNIDNLSNSDDTQTLKNLLSDNADIWDAHHAGTTFRFLTAYLSTKVGIQILTGSDRMKNRPIGDLVDALNGLGAHIEYMEKHGYPPLKIGPPKDIWSNEISLSASTSSQFISALLLIAPTLPSGLTIHLIGEVVSRPYIDMTIGMMRDFGIDVEDNGSLIKIKPQSYMTKDYFVEGDWSAASYYYTIAALSEEASITIKGLMQNSLQGDKAIVQIGSKFGIKTDFQHLKLTITKDSKSMSASYIEQDFLDTPDIAQSVAVMCAGTGKHGLFSGLQTLKIKETDRIHALKVELSKIGVHLVKVPQKFAKKSDKEHYILEGDARKHFGDSPIFDTYEDHRMAMCLAPLALLFPIKINNPEVVSKSYPHFWEDLKKLGFEIL